MDRVERCRMMVFWRLGVYDAVDCGKMLLPVNADEDDDINDIDKKIGDNHDRQVVMMEAVGDG